MRATKKQYTIRIIIVSFFFIASVVIIVNNYCIAKIIFNYIYLPKTKSNDNNKEREYTLSIRYV